MKKPIYHIKILLRDTLNPDKKSHSFISRISGIVPTDQILLCFLLEVSRMGGPSRKGHNNTFFVPLLKLVSYMTVSVKQRREIGKSRGQYDWRK